MNEIQLLKKHWFKLLVAVFVLLWISNNLSPRHLSLNRSTKSYPLSAGSFEAEMAYDDMAFDGDYIEESASSYLPPVEPEVAPDPTPDRMVIRDTWLSMVVKDVGQVITSIQTLASDSGGYMVNSNLSSPESASNGNITVRVPIEQREAIVSQIRDLGVKVVNEDISGRDVTDQYSDLEARLEILYKTQAKFQAIFDQAVEIQDTLEVQRELTNLQNQIDRIIGQQKYLEQSANLTKISVSLSTDELALPYTPDKSWRPQVIFKQAVRSLILTFRSFGNHIIWAAVYSIVWGPLLLAYFIGRKIYLKKSS